MSIVRLTNKQFLERACAVHGDKFEYLDPYTRAHDKISIRCLLCNHIFQQKPYAHIQGQGCPKCANVLKRTNESFAIDARKIHGDRYDYSMVEVVNAHTKVKLVCKACGNIWGTTPHNHLQGFGGCKKCVCSSGEAIIQNYLDLHNICYEKEKIFDECKYKQHLRFDFYIQSLNLCIEYDGKQHFEESCNFGTFNNTLEKTALRDSLKNQYCKNNNIGLLRIPYWEHGSINLILDRYVNEVFNV